MNIVTFLHIAAIACIVIRGVYLIGSRMSSWTDWRVRVAVSVMVGAAPFSMVYAPAATLLVVAVAAFLLLDRRLTKHL